MCTICAQFIPAAPDCPFAKQPGLGGGTNTDPAATAHLPVYTPQQAAEYLTVGFWGDFMQNAGPFAFDVGADRSITANVAGLTEAGRDLAIKALATWTDVSGIAFRLTDDPEAQIMIDDNDPGAAGGPLWLLGSEILSSAVNVSADYIGTYGAGVGSFTFYSFVHEIGHALGLGHPANYNIDAVFDTDATYRNDSWSMSVMSYFSQTENPHVDADYAIPITPQIADIVAIQALYGPPGAVHGGNTTYGDNGNEGGVFDMLLSLPDPTTQTIVDTGGIDWIDVSQDTADAVLDLREGTASSVLGVSGNLFIAPGSQIENARTGSGNDLLRGNALDNLLTGGGGDDTLIGGAGNDTLDGAVGTGDVALYELTLAELDVAVTRDGVRVTHDSIGSDLLVEVEFLAFAGVDPTVGQGTLDVGALDGVGRLSQAQLTTFVEMYIAYFNRAPDALGLYYWGTRLSEGMTLEEIASSFFAQPESLETFPDVDDNAALVEAAYANLLDRAPKEEGAAYWVGELEAGNVSRAEFMLAIINGAKAETGSAEDARTIRDKAAIGLDFAAIEGLTHVDQARAVMERYDATDSAGSVAAVQALIDQFAAAEADAFTMPLVGVIDDPFAV